MSKIVKIIIGVIVFCIGFYIGSGLAIEENNKIELPIWKKKPVIYLFISRGRNKYRC